MGWIVGIIAALISWVVYLYHSLSDARGLLDNQKVKEELTKEQATQDINNATINELQDKINSVQIDKKGMTDAEVSEFFSANKFNDPNKP